MKIKARALANALQATLNVIGSTDDHNDPNKRLYMQSDGEKLIVIACDKMRVHIAEVDGKGEPWIMIVGVETGRSILKAAKSDSNAEIELYVADGGLRIGQDRFFWEPIKRAPWDTGVDPFFPQVDIVIPDESTRPEMVPSTCRINPMFVFDAMFSARCVIEHRKSDVGRGVDIDLPYGVNRPMVIRATSKSRGVRFKAVIVPTIFEDET